MTTTVQLQREKRVGSLSQLIKSRSEFIEFAKHSIRVTNITMRAVLGVVLSAHSIQVKPIPIVYLLDSCVRPLSVCRIHIREWCKLSPSAEHRLHANHGHRSNLNRWPYREWLGRSDIGTTTNAYKMTGRVVLIKYR